MIVQSENHCVMTFHFNKKQKAESKKQKNSYNKNSEARLEDAGHKVKAIVGTEHKAWTKPDYLNNNHPDEMKHLSGAPCKLFLFGRASIDCKDQGLCGFLNKKSAQD